MKQFSPIDTKFQKGGNEKSWKIGRLLTEVWITVKKNQKVYEGTRKLFKICLQK